MSEKYYVVFKGKKPGIYRTWDECQSNIDKYSNAIYKSYNNYPLALAAFKSWEKNKKYIDNKIIIDYNLLSNGPITDSIVVDAACSGNPGPVEYRGIYLMNNSEIFRVGPIEYGTNNIGEFLAIVHALALIKSTNNYKKDIPVYSDSKNAIIWVKEKKVKTRLVKTERNIYLFELIDRATYWLNNNTYSNPILKWETYLWGEIPADFGRK